MGLILRVQGWEWQVETHILPLSTPNPATGHYMGHSPSFAASLPALWVTFPKSTFTESHSEVQRYRMCVRVYVCTQSYTKQACTSDIGSQVLLRARIHQCQLLLRCWSFLCLVLYSLRPENDSNRSGERRNNLVGWMDINISLCLYLTRLMILSFSTDHLSVLNAKGRSLPLNNHYKCIMYETQLTQKGLQRAVQNTPNYKSWTDPVFLHLGNEKPIITLHMLLKDTTVPTICPMVRTKDRVQRTKGSSEKFPVCCWISRYKREEERSAWVQHNLQVTHSDFTLIFWYCYFCSTVIIYLRCYFYTLEVLKREERMIFGLSSVSSDRKSPVCQLMSIFQWENLAAAQAYPLPHSLHTKLMSSLHPTNWLVGQ